MHVYGLNLFANNFIINYICCLFLFLAVVYYSASGAWKPDKCPPSNDTVPYCAEEWNPDTAGTYGRPYVHLTICDLNFSYFIFYYLILFSLFERMTFYFLSILIYGVILCDPINRILNY